MKFTKEYLKSALNYYYETDLDNCTMTHEMWIDELAEAIINTDNYLTEFEKEYKIYKNERK